MIRNTDIIRYNDNLYIVKRCIYEHHAPIISDWQEHLMTDIVLRKDGKLWFCQLIPDAQHITDSDLVD